MLPKRLMAVIILLFAGFSFTEPQYLPLPPEAEPLNSLLPQQGIANETPLNKNNAPVVYEHNVDFESRTGNVQAKITNRSNKDTVLLWNAYYAELADYSMDMFNIGFNRLWLNSFIGQRDGGVEEAEEGSVFNIALPMKIPAWMKDFGFDKPKLLLQGTMDIRLHGVGTLDDLPGSRDNSLVPSPSLSYVPSFTVQGKIGRNITVELNNTEGGLGVRNKVRIVYAEAEPGEFEDYILQRLEAGNTSLSLEGTELTGYAEQHQGLFGIKADWKLGKWRLTTIASQDAGSQESYTIKGNDENTEFQIADKQFSAYKYYFLNHSMRNAYITSKINGSMPPRWSLTGLKVYRRSPPTSNNNTSIISNAVGVYYPPGSSTPIRIEGIPLIEMKSGVDYFFDANTGILRLSAGSQTTLVAVSWSGDGLGHTGSSVRNGEEVMLVQNDAANSSLIDIDKLMLRNVYSVGISSDNYNGFILRMKDRAKNAVDFLKSLGVADTTNGTILTSDVSIFPKEGMDYTGDMILPCKDINWYLRNGYSNSQAQTLARERCLEPLRNADTAMSKIYTMPVRQLNLYQPLYYFESVGKRRRTSISVRDPSSSYSVNSGGCLDIAPNSEKLKAGSEVLVRDVDYQVNYELGQIELISERALDPNKEITVNFECEPLFELQSKLLLGARAEYPIEKLGDGSLFGLTALYKSQNVTSESPQLGGEPFSGLLLGTNIRLRDSSATMDKMINFVPFINTEEKSRWSFEGEFAASYHNTNTSERKSALVDDFESSSINLQYPLSRILWTKASPPGGIASDGITYIEHLDYKHAGEFVWHSNTTILNRQIFQPIGNSDVDNREITIMSLKLKPNDNLTGKSWGGIMRPNSSFYQDLSQKRYIEMVVRGNVGSIYVDLGAVSEDISINGYEPNGKMDSESYDNMTTPKHDNGLGDEVGVYETLRVWDCRYAECEYTDLNRGNVSGANTDISKNKFNANYLDMNDPPVQINGTRGNAGERSYDTEDINRDGQLNVDINFVRYEIDLSTTDKLEFEELQNGWRRFKIPLDQFDTIVSGIGSSLTDILSQSTFTRLWYGNLGIGIAEGRAQIADFKIVGNEWLESAKNNAFEITEDVEGGLNGEVQVPGAVLEPDSNYIRIKVINNRDDAGLYFKSPNTPTERDTDSNEPLREQSLVLEYGGLPRGDSVSATKFFDMEVKDFTSYNDLKMEIHYETEAATTPIRFALQFGIGGLDGSEDYYEWSFKPVKVECQDESSRSCHERNWEANAFSLPLSEFSNLKTRVQEGEERILGGTRDERIKYVGDPSNSNVNWLRFVVIADETADAGDLAKKGTFWINDLRLTGVNNAWGYAFRTHGQLDFSDVLSVSGELRYQDGDFATLKSDGKSPKPTLSEAATRLDANGAASLNVNKFLKDDWGFHIPFGVSYASTTLRPYLKPEDDVELSHDNAYDMFSEFSTLRLETKDMEEEERLRKEQEAKGFQSFERTRTLSLGFSKDYKKNDNLVQEIFGQVFLERPALNYSYRETEIRSARIADSSYSYNTVLEYKLGTFERSNVYLFGNKNLPIEFWPGTFDLTLMDLSYSRSENQERNPDSVRDSIDKVTNFTTDLRHKADIRWNILPFFSINYTLDITRDMYGGGDREAFVKEEFFSPEGKGGLFAKNFIFDFDHTDRKVYYSKNYLDLGDSILNLSSPYSFEIDSIGSREYGRTYGILRNERDRRQDFRTNLSADWIPFLPMRFSFNSGFIQSKAIPDNFDFYNTDMLNKNFWTIQQNNRFEFSPSLRLAQLASIAGKNIVSEFFEKWKWREIRSTWSVDIQTNGEDFTLWQLYEEQNVDPAQYYLFGLGFGDGYRNRGFWNIISGDMGLDSRDDFRGFAQYRNRNTDSLVYQGRFEHNVMRSLTTSTSLVLPWWDISIKGDMAWSETFRQTRENPWYIDTTTIWPRVGVGVEVPNFANRIGFIQGKLRSLSTSHRFDYQAERTIRPYQNADDEFRTTIDFNPIIRINALTQNNIRIENSVRLKIDRMDRYAKIDITDSLWKDEKNEEYFLKVPWLRSSLIVDRGYAAGDELSISTALKTKRGFQFWRWYIKLDNDIDLRLTSGYSYKKIIQEVYEYDSKVFTPGLRTKEEAELYNLQQGSTGVHKELTGPDGERYISYTPELEKISREIPTRSHEWFIRPSVGYTFNKVASASAYIEYRRLTERMSEGTSHTVQNLAFEIAVMLRFN